MSRRGRWGRLTAGVALAWVLAQPALGGAQGLDPVPVPPPLPASGVVQVYGSGPGANTIGPGDLLDVRVFGQAQLSGDLRVGPDGRLTAPFLAPLPAAGRTPAQMQQELAQAYGQLLLHPMVSVAIKEVNSRRIAINGAVPRPGLYAFTGQLTLLEALSLAGGLDTAKASPRVYLFHTSPATTEAPVNGQAHFGVETVLETIDTSQIPAHPELNRELVGGDIINVEEAHSVYVTGDVMHPGEVPFRPGLTAAQLISVAGGLLPQADHSHVRVLRLEPDGVGRQTLTVNLGAVDANHARDLPLQADDIVLASGAPMRMVGLELLDFFTGTERWRVQQSVANAVP